MKRLLALMLTVWAALAAGASAEGYTQAELNWAAGVTDQAALTLAEQAKYLDIQKQRQGGIALLALGGADTPFQIATGAQLAEMAQYVNAGDAAFASAHYVLTDDVDLSACGNWTPIGEEDSGHVGKHGTKQLRRRRCGPSVRRNSALLCHGQHRRCR